MRDSDLTNKVILKIKRKLTPDEETKLLVEEISRLKFRIGELTSEIAELEHKLFNENKINVVQFRKDKYIKELLMQIKSYSEKKIHYKKEMIEWRNKYLNLLNK